MEIITPAYGLFIWLAFIIIIAATINILLKRKTKLRTGVRLFISIVTIIGLMLLLILTSLPASY